MNTELIKQIDDSVGVITDTKQIDKLLVDCKSEIERLTLANETLSALNVEYLERVKALPKQEPVAWVVTCDDDRYYVDIIDDPQLIYDIKNHGATYEPLYTSPPHHIVEANKMINYVPMDDDDFQRIASSKSDIMHNGGWELLYTIYGGSIEAEVVRRMKEQGII